MIKISVETLSEQALTGLVEAFVLREGTDYGHRDVSLEEKKSAVLAALRRGEAQIVFDPETSSTNVIVAQGLKVKSNSKKRQNN